MSIDCRNPIKACLAALLGQFAICLAIAMSITSCSSGQGRQVGFHDIKSLRISGEDRVVVPDTKVASELYVLVAVAPDGHVISARVTNNFAKLDPKSAEKTARKWRFRPPTFEGEPVQALGTVEITYDPPPSLPDMRIPFPQGDLADAEIVLERSACFGTCPDYRVSIRGNGEVEFSTRQNNFPGSDAEVHRAFQGENVVWPGVHRARIDPARIKRLLDAFQSAHFMGMKPEYTAPITDNPTYAITLRVGKISKRVVDYVGSEVGMPASMKVLEDAIDEAAGTRRWTRGNRDTVAMLKNQNFDFRSRDAGRLIQSAIRLGYSREDRRDVGAMIVAMLKEGVDLEQSIEEEGRASEHPSRTLEVLVLRFAAESGNDSLFDAIVDRGVLERVDRAVLSDIFANRLGCSPQVAEALVKAGADPKGSTKQGNALHWLRTSHGMCEGEPDEQRHRMARLLVRLGVPLEARDELGWTPLMGVEDPNLARILLSAGANPNAKAEDGTTPLLATDDDRVALILLGNGSDPRAKNEQGTVRKRFGDGRFPASIAWLDQHGFN